MRRFVYAVLAAFTAAALASAACTAAKTSSEGEGEKPSSTDAPKETAAPKKEKNVFAGLDIKNVRIYTDFGIEPSIVGQMDDIWKLLPGFGADADTVIENADETARITALFDGWDEKENDIGEYVSSGRCFVRFDDKALIVFSDEKGENGEVLGRLITDELSVYCKLPKAFAEYVFSKLG